MRRSPLLVAWLLLGLLAGCPKQTASTLDTRCLRDVDGDLQTVQRRLERGSLDEAWLYLQPLLGCPNAHIRFDFHEITAFVAEERGDLNQAWTAVQSGLRLAESTEVLDKRETFLASMTRFSAQYVWLERSPQRPRDIQYGGLVADPATQRQLSAIAQDQYVVSESRRTGFWVYPDRYRVGGRIVDLLPGQAVGVNVHEGESP